MEDYDLSAPEENPAIELTDAAKGYLRETSKWAYFISIVGFCAVGFLVIMAFTMGPILALFGPEDMEIAVFVLAIGLYFVVAAVMFKPVYNLYKFSTKLKRALLNEDTVDLETAFRYQKSLYKFGGFAVIVFFVLYIIALMSYGSILGVF